MNRKVVFMLGVLICVCSVTIAYSREEAAKHYVAGDKAWTAGQVDTAIAEWRESLKLKPDSSLTKDRLIVALSEKVRLLEQQLAEKIGEPVEPKGSAKPKETKKDANPKKQSTTTDILADELRKNSLIARQFYQDKELLVYGQVHRMSSDMVNAPYITLASSDSDSDFEVHCYLPETATSKDKASFAQLHIKQIVGVSGKIFSCGLNGFSMDNCVLESAEATNN